MIESKKHRLTTHKKLDYSIAALVPTNDTTRF